MDDASVVDDRLRKKENLDVTAFGFDIAAATAFVSGDEVVESAGEENRLLVKLGEDMPDPLP